VDIISSQSGGDPAAVAFDALKAALARNVDLLLIDTAGRLHTKANLMAELAKIHRVMQKLSVDAPHEILLVIDAGTGQNGLSQARQFAAAAKVTGIVLTKLDGTAKGGIIFPIVRELGVPVRFVGLGEGIDGGLIPMKLGYINLGCPKNQVDLEIILGGLADQATLVDDVRDADAMIINTCAFIESSKRESIDTIFEIVSTRDVNPDLQVFVAGCLPSRFLLPAVCPSVTRRRSPS